MLRGGSVLRLQGLQAEGKSWRKNCPGDRPLQEHGPEIPGQGVPLRAWQTSTARRWHGVRNRTVACMAQWGNAPAISCAMSC